MDYKAKLKSARLSLLEAQHIVRPRDDRWKELDEIIAPLEEMIMRRDEGDGQYSKV